MNLIEIFGLPGLWDAEGDDLISSFTTYEDAVRQLNELTQRNGPNSVDYENAVHENPQLDEQVFACLKTLGEVSEEIRDITNRVISRWVKNALEGAFGSAGLDPDWEKLIPKASELFPE